MNLFENIINDQKILAELIRKGTPIDEARRLVYGEAHCDEVDRMMKDAIVSDSNDSNSLGDADLHLIENDSTIPRQNS